MSLRRVAVNAAVILGTLTLVYLLWVFRQALILFLFSLAFAAAARPFVDRLTERGMRRSQALILVYILFIGVLVGILWAISGSLLRDLQQLSDSMARTYEQIWTEWPPGTEVQQAIVRQLPAPADLYANFDPERQSTALQGLLGFGATSANFLTQVVTILILSIYWSIDRVHFERLWLSLLPVESRARSRDVWRGIENDFGAYVRSEVLQSIVVALLLMVGLTLMGVKYPTLLAVFAALVWLIPWMGGVLAVTVVALTALSQSIGLAIFSAAFVLGVLVFSEFYMEPRFIRRRQFSSLFSILLMIAFIEPFGLFGFIVAPPLAAAIELIFRYNLQTKPQPPSLESIQRISELRARVLQVRKVASNNKEPLEAQTLNMLSRLEGLIDKADAVLEKERPPDVPNRTRS